ncbi:DUF3822 family protein [Salmonirosea aquatica]|uniref:DUF3822 family protein n=1 Tax=Salmonirosea aquatica TaxID=2654236 RepID=A0A7C9FFK4_9BACT|nr:DUF3822 family protein [Cytophagaceae bacterium SJW1-29]
MNLSNPALSESQLSPTVKVSQEDFDASRIAQCTLCIEIDETRFRFCFVEEKPRRYIWLEDYAFDTFLNEEGYLEKLKALVSDHPYLPSDQWKDIRVAVNTNAFTLIPTPLFRKEYTADYLQLATGVPVYSDSRVLYHHLTAVDAYTLFSMPGTWSDWLLGQYPLQTIEFYHFTCPLIIGAIASQAEYDFKRLVTIHFEASHFILIYTDGRALKFCNRFTYQNPMEMSYLVLFSLNQLQILPDEVKVLLYGEVTPYSELYTELARFIPKLHFGQNPRLMQYIDEFEDIPEHRYFGLLNTLMV